MPDRLSELVRQRALVSEHLAWLDREIAAARTSAPSVAPALNATSVPAPPATPPPSQPANIVPAAAPASSASASDADAVLDQYRVSATAVKQDVRKGCFLYFAAALLAVGVVVVILYFLIGSR